MSVQIKKLEPVRRMNLTAQVMESVKSYITANDLLPGARLPTEKELTVKLGVSRNILREALKSLEAVGLIEIKVGDGMYVSDFDYSSVVTHISFALSRNEQELEHFIKARLIIEVGALELVAGTVQDADIATLEEFNGNVESATTVEERAEADLEFHRELLAVADNPILSEFGSFLGRFFMEAQYLTGQEAKFGTAQAHRSLIAALKARDAELAKQIMTKHILTWKENR